MEQKIRIFPLHDDEDDFYKFKIEISNHNCSIISEFYGYSDVFNDFSNKLIGFPKSISDEIIFEIGEDSNTWAYHFLFKVLCYEANGNSAIHIKISNNKEFADVENSEFVIKTKPASLNKLGKSLNEWNPYNNKEFIWIAENI